MGIAEVILCEGSRAMPIIGMGTAAYPFASENTKQAVLDAIEIGYRHFDSASLYGSEKPLGEAVVEAIERGFIQSREELFVTSKLWCNDAHPQCVLPAIQKSLQIYGKIYTEITKTPENDENVSKISKSQISRKLELVDWKEFPIDWRCRALIGSKYDQTPVDRNSFQSIDKDTSRLKNIPVEWKHVDSGF